MKTTLKIFQKNLLTWYKKNARDLPWRKTHDPYAIWVSEIMLQQTQVKTVIPYYERWMKRFPTLQALAQAPLDDVLKYWAGLGYYRRARSLHQAAVSLKNSTSQGKNYQVPSEFTELLKVPGIGRYTAGAIASIAYEEKVPVLDGNVIRILTRLYALRDDVSSPKTLKKLWGLAQTILPSKNIGDFNQSLMELGATICFPQNPSCLICPVKSSCKALLKKPANFPYNSKKENSISLQTAALILKKGNHYLLQKQPSQERWGGLWMFPHWSDKKSMLKATDLTEAFLDHRLTVKHGFTKYRISLNVFTLKDIGQNHKPWGKISNKKWIHEKDLSSLAFPSPHQKIVSEILKP